jgi:hypothetical protein
MSSDGNFGGLGLKNNKVIMTAVAILAAIAGFLGNDFWKGTPPQQQGTSIEFFMMEESKSDPQEPIPFKDVINIDILMKYLGEKGLYPDEMARVSSYVKNKIRVGYNQGIMEAEELKVEPTPAKKPEKYKERVGE